MTLLAVGIMVCLEEIFNIPLAIAILALFPVLFGGFWLIGVTIFASANIQNHYWESTTTVPNMTVFACYMVFVGLCFFFGNLFTIAIRIKEDQDLTI